MEILSIIFSGAAFLVSLWVAINVRSTEQATFEGTLQSMYEDIFRDMSPSYRDEEWIPPKDDPAIWKPLERYWYFCFDEYERTAKSPHGIFRKLWKEKFRDRVAAGLGHRPLRFVLADIVHSGGMTSGYANDFLKEMKEIRGSDFTKEFAPANP
jgi:hypothetical protein